MIAGWLTCVVALQRERIFARRYSEGTTGMEHWDPTYEDCVEIFVDEKLAV